MTITAGALVDAADYSDSGWLDTVIYETNWENYVAGVANNHFEYRKIGLEVETRGYVRRTAGASANQTLFMFTLPAGFRPSRNIVWLGLTSATWVTGPASTGTAHTHTINDHATMGPICRIDIWTNGNFRILLPVGATMAIDDWVNFGGLKFSVDN